MTVNGGEFQTMVRIIWDVRISEGQIIWAILYTETYVCTDLKTLRCSASYGLRNNPN